jgi:hypothetical protein
MGQGGGSKEGEKRTNDEEGEDVEVDEMFVSNPKNFRTIELYKTPEELDPEREDLPISNARCFLIRDLLSEEECKVRYLTISIRH